MEEAAAASHRPTGAFYADFYYLEPSPVGEGGPLAVDEVSVFYCADSKRFAPLSSDRVCHVNVCGANFEGLRACL